MDQPLAPTTYILAAGPDGPLQVCAGLGECGAWALPAPATKARTGLLARLRGQAAPWRLVWYEIHGSMAYALARRHSLSRWRAGDLRALVAQTNPDWQNLGALRLDRVD